MAVFVNDSFTEGGADAWLEDHTPETGGAYTAGGGSLGGGGTQQAYIDATNDRLVFFGTSLYYSAATTMASAEYDVTAIFRPNGSPSGTVYLAARQSTSAETGYYGGYSTTNARWELYEAVAGSYTLLDSDAATLVSGTSYTVVLEIRDGTKRLLVDTVERCSSATNVITAAGRVGYKSGGASSIEFVIASAADPSGGGALTAGSATFSSSSATAIVVTTTEATGGTSPYGKQWQRSTVGGGSGFSNISNGGGVSGATTLTLTDGSASAGTLYYYRCVFTDAVPNSVNSNEVSAQIYTGGPISGGGSSVFRSGVFA